MNPTLVTTTQAVDTAFYVILGISGIALLGVTVAMLWFAWRYNRKRQPTPLSQKDHNLWLEVIWTVIPTALVMLMFWYGWEGYLSLRRIPENAMHVKASARMWSWLFTYDNGKTADKLYVPVGQPIKVELVAEDVLHSFYVPAFRVKRDTVPGMTNWVWFTAEQPGSYDLFCAEYCGVGHSAMITTVEALSTGDFQAWLSAVPTGADAGRELLQRHGCLGCHSLDGTRLVGPTFQGIGGRQVVVTRDGIKESLVIDRAYLEEAILRPNAAIVDGYPPAMPPYTGRIPDEELAAMLEYLLSLAAPGKTVVPAEAAAPQPAREEVEEERSEHRAAGTTRAREEPAAGAQGESTEALLVTRGAALAGQLGCLGCHSLDGSRRVGPSFKGLYGQPRQVLRNGQAETMTADADYLKRAITEPLAEIVADYPPAMPPYAQLSDSDLQAMIAWLASLP